MTDTGGREGSPPGSVITFDPRTPGRGAIQIADPRDGAPPLPARVVPQSVPVRVSVVLVEETPRGSTGELPSSLPGEVCSVLAGAAPPASENDNMNDVAAVVPAEAACLVEAGMPFLAPPVGTQSLTVRDATLSPTDPAGILFPANLAEPTTVVGLADAGILFPAVTEGILFPPNPAGILFLAIAEGILFPPDPAGILFPAVSEGILFPPDPAGMPFLP